MSSLPTFDTDVASSNATPNLTDYLTFLQDIVGIPTSILNGDVSSNVTDSSGNQVTDSNGNPVTSSDSSNAALLATVQLTLTIAMDIVNDVLNCASPTLYTLAVYNLAADRLFNFAQDSNEQTYFADIRKNLRLMEPAIGVVTTAGDQGSSTTLLNPETMKNFTLFDLQTLKTPYGRIYMGLAQAYGSTIWGMS